MFLSFAGNLEGEQIHFRVPCQTGGNHIVSAVAHQDRRGR